MTERRTIRRYAHELYPHPEEGEVHPLADAVPYLYARAVGHEVRGTDWFDLGWSRETHTVVDRAAFRLTAERTMALIDARARALHADALFQGLTGAAAWEWAESRSCDETGEIVYDRAVHCGVPVEQIKPYPVLDEVDHHDHLDEPDVRGWRTVHRVDGKESECEACTEPIEPRRNHQETPVTNPTKETSA